MKVFMTNELYSQWKFGNEFLPFHPRASHINPDYRDGWNACYAAMTEQSATGEPVAAPQAVEAMREALERIARWELPEAFDRQGNPSSYTVQYGSNGAQDYMQGVARAGLASHTAPAEPSQHESTWCVYIAGMIGTYLNEPDDSDKVKAIAGIIQRRLWSLQAKAAPAFVDHGLASEPLVAHNPAIVDYKAAPAVAVPATQIIDNALRASLDNTAADTRVGGESSGDERFDSGRPDAGSTPAVVTNCAPAVPKATVAVEPNNFTTGDSELDDLLNATWNLQLGRDHNNMDTVMWWYDLVQAVLKRLAPTQPEPTKPSRHKFWGAGEPDCPQELKAGNGELHTMQCKVCGDGWRKSIDACLATCSICKGSGVYCTGTSGNSEDGNAPILERCECKLGAAPTQPEPTVHGGVKS